MAPDATAFLVVACEGSMTELWSAIRTLRQRLNVSRVHWHPDERFPDGRHFRIEIPVALLANRLQASQQVAAIVQSLGLSVV